MDKHVDSMMRSNFSMWTRHKVPHERMYAA